MGLGGSHSREKPSIRRLSCLHVFDAANAEMFASTSFHPSSYFPHSLLFGIKQSFMENGNSFFSCKKQFFLLSFFAERLKLLLLSTLALLLQPLAI